IIRSEGRSRRGPQMSATPDSTVANPEQLIAELQRQLAEREAELAEAREQQTATAEVIGVINSSRGDLAPVFGSMLDKAIHLCDASFGFLLDYRDEKFGLAAARGLPAKLEEYLSHLDQPRANEGNARVLEGAPYIHLFDLKDDDAYRSGAPLRRAVVDLGGGRSALCVALRKDGKLLGNFNLARTEVR